MNSLQERDYELIAEAKKSIRLNYDQENCNHTVGAAIRCKNGKIYVGVNLYSLHGACAEQVAIGTAITNGEKFTGGQINGMAVTCCNKRTDYYIGCIFYC